MFGTATAHTAFNTVVEGAVGCDAMDDGDGAGRKYHKRRFEPSIKNREPRDAHFRIAAKPPRLAKDTIQYEFTNNKTTHTCQ